MPNHRRVAGHAVASLGVTRRRFRLIYELIERNRKCNNWVSRGVSACRSVTPDQYAREFSLRLLLFGLVRKKQLRQRADVGRCCPGRVTSVGRRR